MHAGYSGRFSEITGDRPVLSLHHISMAGRLGSDLNQRERAEANTRGGHFGSRLGGGLHGGNGGFSFVSLI